LSVPLGFHGPEEESRKLLWDVMRVSLKETKKDKLLFTAHSGWGHRSRIVDCVKSKFEEKDCESFVFSGGKMLDRFDYYAKMASPRFTLAMPGIGYDTFRYLLENSSFLIRI
jgi:hypothetical protein